MLRIYRRHRTSCPQTSERYRRCSCPIYVEGTLGGETVRKALDQTSWQAASDLIASWTAAGRVGAVRTDIPPINSAVQKYLTTRRRATPKLEVKEVWRLVEGHILRAQRG